MKKQASITLLLFLTFVLLFFAPVIHVNNTNELFEFPKTFYLYFISATILMVFVLGIIYSQIKFPKIPFLLSIFMIFLLTNSIFSSHAYTSFWGYYSRFFGGFYSFLSLYVIVVVWSGILNSSWYSRLFQVIALSGIIPAILSWDQHFQGYERPYTTFGQPNWAAAFLVVCFFIALPKVKNLYWFGISVVLFCGLWVTYSISGILGFVIGILIFSLFNYHLIKKHLPYYFALFSLLLLISVTNLGIFSLRIHDFLIDTSKAISQIGIAYAADKYQVSDGGAIRLGIWKGTLKVWQANPKNFFIGTGLQTFPYEFQKYRPADLNYSSEWDFILNRPHNYYLELLSEIGLIGTALYLGLVFQILKKLPKTEYHLIIPLLVTNFFGWPTVVTGIYFFFLYAYSQRNLDA